MPLSPIPSPRNAAHPAVRPADRVSVQPLLQPLPSQVRRQRLGPHPRRSLQRLVHRPPTACKHARPPLRAAALVPQPQRLFHHMHPNPLRRHRELLPREGPVPWARWIHAPDPAQLGTAGVHHQSESVCTFNQNMHVLQRRPVPGFMGPGGRVRLGFGAQIAANISKERRRGNTLQVCLRKKSQTQARSVQIGVTIA